MTEPDVIIVDDDQLEELLVSDPSACEHEHEDSPSIYTDDAAVSWKYNARCGICGVVFTQINKGSVTPTDSVVVEDRRTAS